MTKLRVLFVETICQDHDLKHLANTISRLLKSENKIDVRIKKIEGKKNSREPIEIAKVLEERLKIEAIKQTTLAGLNLTFHKQPQNLVEKDSKSIRTHKENSRFITEGDDDILVGNFDDILKELNQSIRDEKNSKKTGNKNG